MAGNLPKRTIQLLEACWHSIPQAYRTTLLLTTCAAALLAPLAYTKLTHTPSLLPPPPKNPPNTLPLLAQATSSILTLPTGRTLGYAQYGDPTGTPIITLHGLPGSRLEGAIFDADAKLLGARIVALERPGLGLSSPDHHRRSLLDHVADVEALAAHLHLDAFAVLGTSGGGPYALASARAIPAPRLRAVAIVTGLGLVDMSQAWPRWVVFLNRHLDLGWVLRRLLLSGPAWQMELSDEERLDGVWRSFDLSRAHPADVATARRAEYWDWMMLFLASAREAVRQGPRGVLDDAAVLSREPGFRVQEIRAELPVQLWCGTDDTNVSPRAGEQTALRLREGGNGRVELHLLEGEMNGSVQVKWRRSVLEDLLKGYGGLSVEGMYC